MWVGVCVRVITGEKRQFEKNETCDHLASVLATLSRNLEKKRYVVIFPITRSGRVQKSQKKKKFMGRFPLRFSYFP